MTIDIADVDGPGNRFPGCSLPSHQGMPSDGNAAEGGVYITEEEVGGRSVPDLGPGVGPDCIHEERSQHRLCHGRLLLEELCPVGDPSADAVRFRIVVV